jgi:hypothetical protein
VLRPDGESAVLTPARAGFTSLESKGLSSPACSRSKSSSSRRRRDASTLSRERRLPVLARQEEMPLRNVEGGGITMPHAGASRPAAVPREIASPA